MKQSRASTTSNGRFYFELQCTHNVGMFLTGVLMQDLVEKSELIMVGSSPVKTATSVSALGPLDKVAIATFFTARIF